MDVPGLVDKMDSSKTGRKAVLQEERKKRKAVNRCGALVQQSIGWESEEEACLFPSANKNWAYWEGAGGKWKKKDAWKCLYQSPPLAEAVSSLHTLTHQLLMI